MELLQMNAFVSLAKTLHMPQTAQELNTTPSHISKLISSLEAELGVRLFDRVGRGVVLNEHGKLFFEYASAAVQLTNDGQAALKSVRSSVLGTVNIGCYAFSSVLHSSVKAFSEKNPLVNFSFTEVQQHDPSILLHTTDLVLTAARENTYAMQNYYPVSRQLLEEDFYVVISPKLAQFPAGKTTIRMEEVCRWPMVEVAPSPFYHNWVFQSEEILKMREQCGIEVRVGYVTHDFYSKVSLLDAGVGFGLFPDVCVAAAIKTAPSLQVFGVEDYPMHRKILIARKHREQMSAASRAYWDFLLDYYRLAPDKK